MLKNKGFAKPKGGKKQINELKNQLIILGYNPREIDYLIHQSKKQNNGSNNNQLDNIKYTLENTLKMAKKCIQVCKE